MIYTRFGNVRTFDYGPWWLHYRLIRVRGGWELWVRRRQRNTWRLYGRFRPHPWELLEDGEVPRDLRNIMRSMETRAYNWIHEMEYGNTQMYEH